MTTQKVWFITGASRGFGAEIVKAALANGDQVVATARDTSGLAIRLGHHPDLLIVPLDVTAEEQAKTAVDAAIGQFGRIDVLVNNAGFGLLSAVEEASSDEVERNYRTNVFGLLHVTRAVLPHMRQQRSGHVINISSVGGLTGIHGWGIYGSTKFAVEGLTEALATELAPLGIYATTVEPGFFRTDFLDPSSLSTARPIADYAATVGAMRDYATQVNHQQPGSAAKLATAILKLAASPRPPVHLPLGSDTLDLYRKKRQAMEQELADWHEVSVSTDHERVLAGLDRPDLMR